MVTSCSCDCQNDGYHDVHAVVIGLCHLKHLITHNIHAFTLTPKMQHNKLLLLQTLHMVTFWPGHCFVFEET